MASFTTQSILHDRDVQQLLGLYHNTVPKLAHQDGNLFDIEKRDVDKEVWHGVYRSIDKLNAHANQYSLVPWKHYFVRYGPGSFSQMHVDTPSEYGEFKTFVTLLEAHNLVGGYTLLQEKYTTKTRPSHKYAKRHPGDTAPVGQNIIPIVVDPKIGESVIYNTSTPHGVSQVFQGHRLVLVSWYSEREM